MIHASAIAESIVAPALFGPEFLYSLDPKPTFQIECSFRPCRLMYRDTDHDQCNADDVFD